MLTLFGQAVIQQLVTEQENLQVLIHESVSSVEPLAGVSIELSIGDLRYREVRMTDASGRVSFDALTSGILQSDAMIRIVNTAGSPMASRLEKYTGSDWKHSIRFGATREVAEPQLTRRLSLPAPSWAISTIAIADIACAGLDHDDGAVIREWFAVKITESGYFRVVAREGMVAILQEQQFQAENCADT